MIRILNAGITGFHNISTVIFVHKQPSPLYPESAIYSRNQCGNSTETNPLSQLKIQLKPGTPEEKYSLRKLM